MKPRREKVIMAGLIYLYDTTDADVDFWERKESLKSGADPGQKDPKTK
jgi:hypothetical protein